ncbi:protein FAM229A [Dermochelys coriacea]|uniref:protein FAM229A n=1 Tax=Dermochelys coriacea TaxID=27794 RepID=UPI0018E85225|nr:protein FAM229A [Dermochelys coriacea]XP_038233490.1 protein FAM229A [Dermochelys coriacea]XP_043361893.1 protein FAM229A [Dermochelys coriacea]
MSSQETPQARRFPIEAGDSPSLAAAPETQEPVATEHTAARQLRRCPGCHCLTLPNVPIDVYIAMGGTGGHGPPNSFPELGSSAEAAELVTKTP